MTATQKRLWIDALRSKTFLQTPEAALLSREGTGPIRYCALAVGEAAIFGKGVVMSPTGFPVFAAGFQQMRTVISDAHWRHLVRLHRRAPFTTIADWIETNL